LLYCLQQGGSVYCYTVSNREAVYIVILSPTGRQCILLHCLRQGGSVSCDGRDDAEEFANVRSAMKVLTFADEEIMEIWKILAAILHMGNITYKGMSTTMFI